MTTRVIVLASSLFTLACLVTPAAAQQDNEALKKDLTAVIALQGLPCGEVVDVMTQAENDYLTSCKDGNRYRVYMTAAGRVVVEKRK